MFSDGWLRPRKQGSGGVSKSIKGPSSLHALSTLFPFRRKIFSPRFVSSNEESETLQLIFIVVCRFSIDILLLRLKMLVISRKKLG